MIPFECPHCGQLTQVHQRYTGHSGPCAACGKTIHVPESSTGVNTAPAESTTRIPNWLRDALIASAGLLSVTLTLVLLFSLVTPAVKRARQTTRQRACTAQVERIARAIYAYRNDHGSFPPAYTVDAQQIPLHSWRVLILPYLGAGERNNYGQIMLNEPWNSPTNRAFASRVPAAFVCPVDQPFAPGDTSYCAVVGPRYAFRGGSGVDPSQFSDDLATTLMIVEVHKSCINWMQPSDITVAELALGIGSGVQGSCGSRHAGGVISVATADARSHLLSDSIPSGKLLEMSTVDGGESLQQPFVP